MARRESSRAESLLSQAGRSENAAAGSLQCAPSLALIWLDMRGGGKDHGVGGRTASMRRYARQQAREDLSGTPCEPFEGEAGLVCVGLGKNRIRKL